MKPQRSLGGCVVVITGASSGIGLATALAFARRGASVALGARRTEALERAAEACETAGGRAIAVTTDVTDENSVAQLAEAAVARFGRIDVWINNAGVGLFGPYAAAKLDAHRRVVEINLFGAMHGAAAALPYFLRQERGILITNVSIGGFVPVPFAAAYTASKFALRGFMASLRQELRHVRGIRLCSVFPAVMDTPGFSHGANVSGRRLTPGWPIFPPEKVADVMVSLATHPRDEVSVGWPTPLAKAAYALAPLTTERVAGGIFRRYVRRAPPDRKTIGNLFEPMPSGTGTTGGWRKRPRLEPALTRRAIAGGVAATSAAILATMWLRRGASSASHL
jgi:short-subunit dehydrogenase